MERQLFVQLGVTPLRGSLLHRRVTHPPLREPVPLSVVAVLPRATMHTARRLLALPLRYLRLLLNLRQRIERVGGQPKRLRYPEVPLMLGE